MEELTPPVRPKKGVTGVLTIHSSPSALRTHIEWALHNLIGTPVALNWKTQPHAAGTYRTTLEFRDRSGLAASMTKALRSWHYIRFEVQEMDGDRGQLFRFTPDLGLHRADIDAMGSILINETSLHNALSQSFDEESLRFALNKTLGTEWDAELDIYRGVELQEALRLKAI